MHVALAADRRRVGELVGRGAHGVQHLLLAAAGARRRRNPRQRFKHHGRGHQGTEILQRNLDAGNLAQESVDRRGRDGADRAGGVAVLEHAPTRQHAQNANGAHEFRRVAFLAHGLAALGLEGQHKTVVVQHDVGLEQRGGAAGAVELGVGFVAGTDRGARDQLDHRRQREFARRLVTGQMRGDVAANLRQRADQLGETVGLAMLAHLLPIGMVAVLQPAGSIDADCLQVRIRVGRVAHVAVGRRHRHPVEPANSRLVADLRTVGANE